MSGARRGTRMPTGVALALALALALATACESDGGTGTDAIAPRVVVHAVLDPLAPEQVILVERSRLDVREPWPSAPPEEIILAYGGDPIRDARVVLYDANGDSAVAVEDGARRPDGLGWGVYRVATRDVAGAAEGLASLSVRSGTTYRLRIETSLGVVRGLTTVPAVPVHAGAPVPVEHDLNLQVVRTLTVPRVEAPAHVTSVSGDAYRTMISGDAPTIQFVQNILRATTLKHIGEYPLPACAPQTLSIAAADRNYASYAQARDRDNLHGDDLRTAGIAGGSGVFGAVVPYAVYRITSRASVRHALEGRWQAVGTTPADALDGMELCLHASHFQDPGGLNGTWSLGPKGPTGHVFGGVTSTGTRVALNFESIFTIMRATAYDATVRGDTLDGRELRTGQRVRFVRQASP